MNKYIFKPDFILPFSFLFFFVLLSCCAIFGLYLLSTDGFSLKGLFLFTGAVSWDIVCIFFLIIIINTKIILDDEKVEYRKYFFMRKLDYNNINNIERKGFKLIIEDKNQKKHIVSYGFLKSQFDFLKLLSEKLYNDKYYLLTPFEKEFQMNKEKKLEENKTSNE